MTKFATFLTIGLLTLGLAACGGDKKLKGEAGDAGVGSDVTSRGIGEGVGPGGEAFGSEADLRARRRVHFEFDSSALDAESRAVAEAHARYLVDNPDIRVTLEGHADERGTREYNLALGERRARSVAQVMQALGVSRDRINEVSFGEEKPLELGHGEAAWSMNRRVEILYGSY